jgi:hypothetical protein
MYGFVSEKFKMVFKSGVLEHRHGVSANEEHFAFFDFMVSVQNENPRGRFDGPFIFHSLAIIFTIRLEVRKFEKPISGRYKLNAVTFFLESLILDSDL